MKETAIKSITQILLIVFSVVLGIFLSERLEERKKEREAALLFSKIKSEVIVNKKLIEHWLPYHKEVMQRLDSLSNDQRFINSFIDDESALFNEILTRGTLMGRTPSNDAWDIAKAHPLVVHFDYDDLLILSKIYNQQIMTYEAVPKIIELLLSSDFNSKKKAKQNLLAFKNLMWEIVGREIQLMDYFQEAEKILDLQENQKKE